jgi:hypothetical protein
VPFAALPNKTKRRSERRRTALPLCLTGGVRMP